MQEEGKQTKTNIPRQIIFKREGEGKNGKWYLFEITFDNGDKGSYFAKSKEQTEFKEGVSIEYVIEVKKNGEYFNTVIQLPFKGKFGGGKSFNPSAQNKQVALTNAVDIFISGHITKEEIEKTANWFFKYLQGEPSNESK